MIKITLKEYYYLLESWFNNKNIGQETYILKEKNRHIAIDNSTNEFFTEEFETLAEVEEYLNSNSLHKK